MFCTSCGTKNAAENNFCRQCGHKFDKAATLNRPDKISEETFDSGLPNDEQVSALLERAYRQRKDNDLPGAVALCEEALRLNPDSTSAHSLLGQIYEAGGNREQAIRQYERVLELNPGSIADRVKLDQLREEIPLSAKTGAPRITLVDRGGSRLSGGMFVALGVGLMLILLGGVLALQLRPRSTETTSAGNMPLKPDYDNSKPSVSDSGAGKTAVNSTSNPAASNGNPASSPGPTAITANSYGTNTGTGLPPLVGTMPNGFLLNPSGGNGYSAPPVRPYNPTPPAASGQGSPPAAPNRGKPAAGNGTKTDTMDNDSGDPRVHLNAVSDNDPPIIIKVNKVDSPAGNSGNNNGAGSADSGSNRADTAYAASADSRAYIAMGQDRMNHADYAGAIQVFRKALASANDDSAYVYEQIGHCYKGKGENKNAISSYENAIQKYKELISAGRQMETARNGIRACETGKKICSGE